MSIVIDLPPDVEAKVRADVALTGRSLEVLAADAVAAWYGANADSDETLTAIREGIADAEAGRYVTLDEFKAMYATSDANSLVEAARSRLRER